MRSIFSRVACIGLIALLMACSGLDEDTCLDTLRIGILPDESVEQLRKRHAPLIEFIAEELGVPYELTIPDSYTELVDIFGKGELDLVYFGGFTFVKANKTHNAIPLVIRDVDNHLTSVLLVGGNSSSKDFSQLKGKRFSFGSRLSTSGHLMPRFFIQTEQGFIPENYFGSVHYSGRHDRTAYWIRDGKVDAGIANSIIIRKMLKDGRLLTGQVKIIWETPPYSDYVWAARSKLCRRDREKILQIFLKLSPEDPQHKSILSNASAGGFLPASERDFSQLVTIVVNQGLLK